MPFLIVLPFTDVALEILRTAPEAPTREPGWTTEIKGKHRRAEGTVYRLPVKPWALFVGRLVEPLDLSLVRDEADFVRDLDPEDIDAVRANLADEHLSIIRKDSRPWWDRLRDEVDYLRMRATQTVALVRLRARLLTKRRTPPPPQETPATKVDARWGGNR